MVEAIQAAALDRSVPVADLLRRVKLAAAKLKLTDTLEWVDRELNGYGACEIDELPRYRIANGTLMENTLYHGTRLAHGDPETISFISMCDFREPVSALESLLEANGDRLAMPLNVDIAKRLQRTRTSGTFNIHFSKNVVVGIVDTVRNLVLDWAIKLENEGILGEGVSFSMEEKKLAAEATPNIQITNYGVYHHGDSHGHQNRMVAGGSTDNSTNTLSVDVFQQLQTAVGQIGHAADREVLLELIKQMDAKKGTSGFKEAYTSFVVSAANHMTMLAPFLPALAHFLPG